MSTSPAALAPRRASEGVRLFALLLGNLVIGTGILLPAGMLSYIAADFAVTVPIAGWLIAVSGLVVGLGSPVFATLAGGFDRRSLLIGSMLLYAAGHLASAFAPNFLTLLVIRGVMTVAAGVFTPQAAAAVGLLVPGERRASGIAFIFLGWSLASVAGIPLGGFVASWLGARYAFMTLAPVALLAAGLVAVAIPSRLPNAQMSVASWFKVLRSGSLLCLLAATVASMCGQFLVLTYIQPLLRDSFGAGPMLITMILLIYGLAGLVGNGGASHYVTRFGLDRMVHGLFAAVLIGFLLMSVSFGSLWVFGLGLTAWGLGSFASNSLQQARLVAIDPPMAAASVALNTSSVYLGQAMGAAAGGRLYASGALWAFGPVAALVLLCAVAFSLAGDRSRDKPELASVNS